jgi:hypothetical protein
MPNVFKQAGSMNMGGSSTTPTGYQEVAAFFEANATLH